MCPNFLKIPGDVKILFLIIGSNKIGIPFTIFFSFLAK